MKEQLNKIINGYFQRKHDAVGARYFEQDYVGDMLSDQQVTRDILDLAREIAPLDKRVKQG
jgi:hypothetical protein